MYLAPSNRAMLDAARDDEEVARAHCDVTVAQADCQFAGDDEEELIGSSCLCHTNSPRSFTTLTS